jgi:hypothetical protein
MRADRHEFGVGATEELSLRVSVAALVRVLFESPEDGRAMLALERVATLLDVDGRAGVRVQAKPFGGAVRLSDPQALRQRIGNFNYDSERSREEGDFRLQIRPTSWEKVKQICRDHLRERAGILDTSPQRELEEEFEDSVHVRIAPAQYRLKSLGLLVEDTPRGTPSVRATGRPTVRAYYVFEARLKAREVILALLTGSRRQSDQDLQTIAREDARQGGMGRANGVLTVGLDDVKEAFRGRSGPVLLGGHQLDGNVAVILNRVDRRQYPRRASRPQDD